MAGREQVRAREIGFTGGNIDWAQKLSGRVKEAFGSRVPISQLPVVLAPRLQHDQASLVKQVKTRGEGIGAVRGCVNVAYEDIRFKAD